MDKLQLENKIKELEQQLEIAKEELFVICVNEYKQKTGLKEGDIIETNNGERGIINCFIDKYGDITPEAYKLTKSGKPHKTAKMFIFYNDKIKKVT